MLPAPLQPFPRWSKVLWLVVWAVSIGVSGALYLQVPPNPDQAIFDYIGWIGSEGGRYYVDAAEQNWPGAMFLHEMATRLFGNHLYTFRLLDYLLVLLACGVLYGLCRLARADRAALFVVALYPPMYVTPNPWMSGQRDIVAAHWLLAAGACLLLRQRGRGRGWLTPMALLILAAVLVRPTYLLFAPLALGVDVLLRRQTGRSWGQIASDTAVALGVMLAAAGAVLGWAYGRGVLGEWLQLSIVYNSQVYSRTQTYLGATWNFLETLWGWHWYVVFAAAGAVVWIRARRFSVLAVLLAVSLTCIGSYYAQLKGFGYHLGGLLPVVALLMAALLGHLWEMAAMRPMLASRLVLAAAVGFSALGLAKKTAGSLGRQLRWYAGAASTAELRDQEMTGLPSFTVAHAVEAAELARKRIAREGTLLVWGRPVIVNYLAERRSPSRFITIGILHWDSRSPLSALWTEEFRKAFDDNPPELVLVPAPGTPEGPFWTDPEPSEVKAFLRDRLRRDYLLERHIGSMEVHARGPAPGG